MGKAEVVVDTNVPLVANGKADQAGWKCEDACVRKLIQVQAGRRTLRGRQATDLQRIPQEISASTGQPGVGDAFFKWLWENQANPQHCRIVPVTVHDGRGFEEFPDSARLSSFDRSDRKFVAFALAKREQPEGVECGRYRLAGSPIRPWRRMASTSFFSARNSWRRSADRGKKKRPREGGRRPNDAIVGGVWALYTMTC